MRYLKSLLCACFLMAGTCLLFAETVSDFDSGWRFCLGDDKAWSDASFDDTSWRLLDLPHDWAIEGNFSVDAPSGAGGGALPGGIGWYRKHFKADPKGLMYIDFDGVYMNSTVWINGHELGTRPFGYISFRYELTPYINHDSDNVIAVRVDDSDQPNSRWYSGCGIYRHTHLIEANPIHVAHWSIYVTTELSENQRSCILTIQTDIEGMEKTTSSAIVRHTLFDAEGVAKSKSQKDVSANRSVQKLLLKEPKLWSTEHPYIYTIRTELICDGKIVDIDTTQVGIRSIAFTADRGFFLNGKNMKINGVCLHHDHGCLGAAFSEDALHRQLSKLKEMGVNAIRCSHNPPAPELLNMCDTMGLLMMDECFDMWQRRKTKNDYARFFDEWHERDLSDMLRRDRNHPSIIIWSIGNEVLEQRKDGSKESGIMLARHLADIVKKYDPTRPITAGCDEPKPSNLLFRSGALDITGYNYHNSDIPMVPKHFPGKPFILTESVSSVQSRGVYVMPSDSLIVAPPRWDIPYTAPEYTRSAYDHSRVPWGNFHEETWDLVKHTAFVSGQFIWTGSDYIGEPTPFGFPAHSSYFGIIDLAGFPKDVYYMYQSEWTDKTVLHLFPHWNWLPGQEVDMWCYYNNADEVELFVNGESQGIKHKDEHAYHTCWRVQFAPGTVEVVSRLDGKEVTRQAIHTASQPHHLELRTDYCGKELTFITVNVEDEKGNLCPMASDKIYFTVENGKVEGVDNGDAASLERYKADTRHAFNGKAMVVVRPNGKGPMKLIAQAVNLMPDSLVYLNDVESSSKGGKP